LADTQPTEDDQMKLATVLRSGIAGVLVTVALSAYAQDGVQQLADRWVQAYNKHDRAALGGVYTENARLMMHGAPTIAGRERIEEYWTADFEVGNPLTLLTVTHSVSGTDMMLVHGDYKVISREDGSQLGYGRFAHIWTRDGDRVWRLDRDLWNQPFEPYDPAAAGSDVQTLANRWTHAYNSHDRAALAAVYDEDARLMMHGAPTIAGRSGIESFWAEDFEESNPLTLLTVTHAVDGLDMVLVHGNYEVVNRDDGMKVGLGRFAHVWIKDGDGEWRLDRDLWLERSEPFEL
jgi:uncharacterized protein (TIGR02246 family)